MFPARTLFFCLFAGLLSGARPGWAAAESAVPPGDARPIPRVGDAGSVLDEKRLDPAWPDMRGWAEAGVRGGIPNRSDTPIVKRLKPGDDLQAALDAVPESGGVVLLAPGRYPLDKRLDLRSGAVLRGEEADKTILEVRLRTAERWEREIVGVRMLECRRAALEDLTILHPAVEAMDTSVYRELANDHNGIADLHVGHVFICLSESCWIQNCRLLCAGTDPLVVNNSKHITLRDNVVKGCFNKGGDGNGYYLLHKSSHVLCFNEQIEGLRHVCVQTYSAWCAIIDCRILGDLNFHGEDGGHNLVEGCAIERPRRHPWGPIGYWEAPRGPGNLLYRNDTGSRLCRGVAADPLSVFALRPETNDDPIAHRVESPAPRAGTLYPMTGARSPKQIQPPPAR
jgi:hypothetical protein